jgi:hypothetical protein|tara:strand:- start:2020 stop:2649 length:630 start_codon:yes stop_codon:yes gene_type:complete
MAESYPLAFPTQTGIAQVQLIASDVVSVTESPFTLSQQVVRHAGARWSATINIPPVKRSDAEYWNSFLLRLRGQFGTFLVGDPNAATPRGSASSAAGTPVVNGASQTGNNLNIDGLPASATGYLKAGDYIQLGTGATSRLYKVLEDVNSNGSGQATLNLWPDLRSSPANDATVVVSNAKGLFRLAQNDASWTIGNDGFYSITFSAVEAL